MIVPFGGTSRASATICDFPPPHMSLCRCSRCESLFYKEEASHTCRYHTGHFRAWWSCCKEPMHGAPGCRAGLHVEDAGYTAMLDSLCAPAEELPEPRAPTFIIEGPNGTVSVAEVSLSPVHRREQEVAQEAPAQEDFATLSDAAPAMAAMNGEAAIDSVPDAITEDARTSTEKESSSAAGGSGTRTVPVPYVVAPHDTWHSICLRHRMSSAELLHLNGLRNRCAPPATESRSPSPHASARNCSVSRACACCAHAVFDVHRRARVGDVLLVWVERSDEQRSEDWRRQLVRQFRRLAGCSAAEAVYYLEAHEYRIGDALGERTHDGQWEAERALLVHTINDEEDRRKRQAEDEQAAREAAETEAAAMIAAALARQARAAAHAEALRSLSSCLPPAAASNSPARCLACLG